jgi:hypothetical protein
MQQKIASYSSDFKKWHRQWVSLQIRREELTDASVSAVKYITLGLLQKHTFNKESAIQILFDNKKANHLQVVTDIENGFKKI